LHYAFLCPLWNMSIAMITDPTALSSGPAFLPDQLDEADVGACALNDVSGLLLHDDEVLGAHVTDGKDYPATIGKLIDPWRGDFRSARPAYDAVKGSLFRPSERAVSGLKRDIVYVEHAENAHRLVREFVDSLDGIDVPGECGKKGGLVSATRTDVQYLVVRLCIQFLEHHCHDERLGDCLAAPDRNRVVGVGFGYPFQGDEAMSRDLLEGT